MTAYNFKAQFAGDVESGKKRQTIRAERKDRRVPRAGEELQLYTGMRTKGCRKLRDVICDQVSEVSMSECGMKMDGIALAPLYIEEIAILDGFESIEAFRDYFKDTYGFPFHGHLIKWRLHL